MSPNGSPGYRLRHLPLAAQQVKDLAKVAAKQGTFAKYVAALNAMVDKLRREPSTWGDPEFNLKTPGGCVYHAILGPVFAQYAVFEHEKVVLLMKVLAASGSGLDQI